MMCNDQEVITVIKNKIKYLLKMKAKTNQDCADMPYHSFTNKRNQRGFKTEELIWLAELTGTKLAFLDEKKFFNIIFDNDDIKK